MPVGYDGSPAGIEIVGFWFDLWGLQNNAWITCALKKSMMRRQSLKQIPRPLLSIWQLLWTPKVASNRAPKQRGNLTL